MTPLSHYFDGICAIRANLDETSAALRQRLRRHGPLHESRGHGASETLDWFLPLASQSTRYLVVPTDNPEWCMLLHNGLSIAASHMLWSVTRVGRCAGVQGHWGPGGCKWEVVNEGVQIQGAYAGNDSGQRIDHWQGADITWNAQADLDSGTLTPEAVRRMLASALEIDIPPDWRRLLDRSVTRFERSNERSQVPNKIYDVWNDL